MRYWIPDGRYDKLGMLSADDIRGYAFILVTDDHEGYGTRRADCMWSHY